jgi:hypothetical protein
MIIHHKMNINSNDILVTVDGEEQKYGVDYEVINDTVTFKVAPEAGTIIKVYKRKDGKTSNQ